MPITFFVRKIGPVHIAKLGLMAGPSGLVLARPLFQGGLTYSSVNKKIKCVVKNRAGIKWLEYVLGILQKSEG